MKRMLTFLTALALSQALGQESSGTSERDVEVAVGESTTVGTGYARGVSCDDPEVVRADILTADGGESNEVTLTGLAEGRTLCVAGNVALGGPRLLLKVHVKKSKKAKDSSKPKTQDNAP
jgi:hypothetical protein